MCLLGVSFPVRDDNEEDQEEDQETRRRKRRNAAAVRIVAGGTLAVLTAWALVSYRRRRRRRLLGRAHALTASAASATAAIARHTPTPTHAPTPAVAARSAIMHAPLPYNATSALESPLSLLLHHAKRGGVLRVRMNKNTVAYQLAGDISTGGGGPTAASSAGGGTCSGNRWRRSTIPPTNGMAAAVTSALGEGGCTDISSLPESLPERLLPLAIASIPFVYLALAYRMLNNVSGGGGEIDTTNVVGGGGDGNADGDDDDDGRDGRGRVVTFRDVAGVDSAREELYEVVRYLSDPAPYRRLGASPPRGILLHGAPGCGKTLLARAVAGEARADYFVTCSGSDFVELYVGQGAKRVRGLFRSVRDAARGRHRRQIMRSRFVRWWNGWVGRYFGVDGIINSQHSASSPHNVIEDRPPTAVIFIDEIDALAKCRDGIGRGAFIGGGNDEREQTLNALLTEMDGFGTPRDVQTAGANNEGDDVVVIVIAATNRRSVLDPALLRPGRFDRHVEVPNPDRNGREAILRVHARRIKLDGAKDTSCGSLLLSELADESFTGGMSGADLRNVINEAALLSVRASRHNVGWDQLVEAARRVRHMNGQ